MNENVRCEDKILQTFFEKERWEYAIAKGVGKDVPKNWLYQLCKPEMRVKMYLAIKNGTYEIAPPHTALIPKETPGEFRTVYVNEPADRVLLSIANDLLFELCPEMVHPRCKSYLKGVGCGRVVQEVSRAICHSHFTTSNGKLGWKSDLSKYFDSVPIRYIDAAFDRVEEKHGHSALIDVLRKYYHSDLYFTPEKKLAEAYQSLKQGCSVASWLADVILYHIDDKLAGLNGYYVRYSDDMLFIGPDAEKAMAILSDELAAMGMKLNPKKVEWLDAQHWFKFLGFSIKGESISLSSTRIKRFQKEIEARTIDVRGKKEDVRSQPSAIRHRTSAAISRVNRYLYHGDGQGHSWATGVLPIINVREDVDTLNAFVMDCLRAVYTGKTKLGGLGYCKEQKVGCISRGRGRNVSSNRRKTGDDIGGYLTIGCMQNAMRTSKAAYDTLVRSLSYKPNDSCEAHDTCGTEEIEAAYAAYKHSIPSEKTMNRTSRFKALPESELSDEDMLYGVKRVDAERELEQTLAGFTMPEDAGSWFWQSPNDRDLVVLRSWTNHKPLLMTP